MKQTFLESPTKPKSQIERLFSRSSAKNEPQATTTKDSHTPRIFRLLLTLLFILPEKIRAWNSLL